jgi:hypothetical protein
MKYVLDSSVALKWCGLRASYPFIVSLVALL